eukprot:CAMPEP_0197031126 /NCGR_PEP_ID=MMETSP1384-20130603/10220_1 /TAXON_ID=29189 /ORGANISM="Ammonia sp." /LENGTH=110 /DNA_ID=CAMNT_0042460611 /DNA_START=14 /DNA_END=343 /DNA_ORIENTATION=+
MAFSFWGFVLYSGFFPFIACILLVISPNGLRKYTYRTLEALFFFDFFGKGYPIIHFFLVTEGILLGYLIKETMETKPEEHKAHDVSAPVFTLHPKSKQWRAQRNCYATAW